MWWNIKFIPVSLTFFGITYNFIKMNLKHFNIFIFFWNAKIFTFVESCNVIKNLNLNSFNLYLLYEKNIPKTSRFKRLLSKVSNVNFCLQFLCSEIFVYYSIHIFCKITLKKNTRYISVKRNMNCMTVFFSWPFCGPVALNVIGRFNLYFYITDYFFSIFAGTPF